MEYFTIRRSAGVSIICALCYAPPSIAGPITLEQAWQHAEQNNPALRQAEAARAASQGELNDSRALLWNNPQLSTERRKRQIPQTAQPSLVNREWSAGLAQTFEIAGQQGLRRDAAERLLAATEENIAETRRQVRAEVERRFVRVLGLQQRIRTEQEASRLIDEAAVIATKRVSAGEDSRLDGNLAKVEAGRARNQLALLREQLTQAQMELAAALQLPADELPETTGELEPQPGAYTLEALLASAAERPALRAVDQREQAARARLGLERASVYPDVTLGLSASREGSADAREKITALSISLPLPLFRRNEGGIGRAASELTQTQVEKQASQRDIPAQVRVLWSQLESLRGRVKRLSESVLPSLEENRRLAAIAYRSGELGLPQLLLVSRQVLDGQRDMVEARTELRLVQVALEESAGWPQAALR